MSNENGITRQYNTSAKWFVTTKQGHIEKTIGNNVQNWLVSEEKWRVNKSCFSGTEHLENFARGFQD